MSNTVESTVKTKLGIKFVDAKKLVELAKDACEITSTVPPERFDEVIEEACELFADLPPTEQEEMKAAASVEPEWKRKAREACEKREAEFQSKLESEAQTEAIRAALRAKGASEEEINKTTVKTVRKIDDGAVEVEEPRKGKKTVRRHTCYCIVQ